MTVGRATLSAAQQSSRPWARLAAVARERASEQSARAIAASDTETAGPHFEQNAYLVRLAEVYEKRAKDGAGEN